jgi:polar amino acid transport system substrate-binding protein
MTTKNLEQFPKAGSGISRRSALASVGAALAATQIPAAARAQARVAPPVIIKAGTLMMSINPTLPPLQFVNDRGEIQGLRAELGNELAKRMGLAAEYFRIDGVTTMIPGLAARRWDMINTGIFWTEERSKIMYMVPYEGVALSILVQRGNPQNIRTVDDFAGKRISCEQGSIEERRTRELSELLVAKGLRPIEVRSFNNFAEAFQALRAGQVEGTTAADATAMFMQTRGDFTRAVSGLFAQEACLAFINKPLAELVAGLLTEMKKDGFYDALMDKYGVLKLDTTTFAIKGTGPA